LSGEPVPRHRCTAELVDHGGAFAALGAIDQVHDVVDLVISNSLVFWPGPGGLKDSNIMTLEREGSHKSQDGAVASPTGEYSLSVAPPEDIETARAQPMKAIAD
jgi:hypothetical protein